jgi:hypothetical protein
VFRKLRQQCGGDALELSFAGPFFSLIASFLFIASNISFDPKVNIARAIARRR